MELRSGTASPASEESEQWSEEEEAVATDPSTWPVDVGPEAHVQEALRLESTERESVRLHPEVLEAFQHNKEGGATGRTILQKRAKARSYWKEEARRLEPARRA